MGGTGIGGMGHGGLLGWGELRWACVTRCAERGYGTESGIVRGTERGYGGAGDHDAEHPRGAWEGREAR
eukprot:287722-Rhodomonas_salina.2